MIIWKGYGFLVLVIAVAIGAIVSLVFGSIGSTEDTGAAVGAIISGVVIWFLGNKLNADDKNKVMIDKQTGQEVIIKPNHSLFFIKMQYWAFIIAGIGIVMLCDILIHGKSSL
jgi:hypothetical protein